MTNQDELRKEIFSSAQQLLKKNGRVLAELATGFGKTKLALDLACDYGAKNAVVLVPTLVIGESWVAEVKKWNSPITVTTLTYNSVHKIPELLIQPDIIVLDEVHRGVTDLRMETLRQLNMPMIALSATIDGNQAEKLNELGFSREIKVSLDHAVEADIVVPYEMNIITFPIDKSTKNIPGGNKKNPFMTTEDGAYKYTNVRISAAKKSRNENSIAFAYMARMRMIRTLPSRMRIAERVIARLRSKFPDAKILVFAPDIESCEKLVPDCFYHSKSDPSGFEAFKAGRQPVLGSVGMLDEGVNIAADIAIIVAGMSGERRTIQRLGRLLRKTSDGKVGRAFLLVAEGTQDTVWAENSTENLSNVKSYTAAALGL